MRTPALVASWGKRSRTRFQKRSQNPSLPDVPAPLVVPCAPNCLKRPGPGPPAGELMAAPAWEPTVYHSIDSRGSLGFWPLLSPIVTYVAKCVQSRKQSSARAGRFVTSANFILELARLSQACFPRPSFSDASFSDASFPDASFPDASFSDAYMDPRDGLAGSHSAQEFPRHLGQQCPGQYVVNVASAAFDFFAAVGDFSYYVIVVTEFGTVILFEPQANPAELKLDDLSHNVVGDWVIWHCNHAAQESCLEDLEELRSDSFHQSFRLRPCVRISAKCHHDVGASI